MVSIPILRTVERDAIIGAPALHGGDQITAAQALGMSRATVYRKIRGFAIIYLPSTAAPKPE